MKEKSIILSSADVRAVLDGTKTQHRVRMKTQPPDDWQPQLGICAYMLDDGEKGPDFFGVEDELDEWCYPSPWGAPGERVWVKEPWRTWFDGYLHKATPPKSEVIDYGKMEYKRASSMPREASRLTLEITGVSLDGPPWEWVYALKVYRSDKRDEDSRSKANREGEVSEGNLPLLRSGRKCGQTAICHSDI